MIREEGNTSNYKRSARLRRNWRVLANMTITCSELADIVNPTTEPTCNWLSKVWQNQ